MKELLLIKRLNSKDVSYNYNPVCHDDKIHIRLKHYSSSNKMIIGFEDKLTFLIVYMLNNYLRTLENKPEYKIDMTLSKSQLDVFGKYMVKFKETDSFRILSEIICNKFITCKAIRISALYSRKDKPSVSDLFGHIAPNILPKTPDDTNSLSFFTKTIGITIQDYLFNDNYILLISNFKFKNPNEKFENKVNKKIKKRLSNGVDDLKLEENTLW